MDGAVCKCNTHYLVRMLQISPPGKCCKTDDIVEEGDMLDIGIIEGKRHTSYQLGLLLPFRGLPSAFAAQPSNGGTKDHHGCSDTGHAIALDGHLNIGWPRMNSKNKLI